MWLPALADTLTSGRVDVVITCGLIPAPDGIANEVFCAEPLLVGLRPEHRLAGQNAVALNDLAHDVLGTTPADLQWNPTRTPWPPPGSCTPRSPPNCRPAGTHPTGSSAPSAVVGQTSAVRNPEASHPGPDAVEPG